MLRVFTIALLSLVLVACAGERQRGVTSSAGQKEAAPKVGVVEAVTAVELPDEGGGSGAYFGSIFGNIGGANVGGGRGGAVGSVLGTVLGGTAGDAAQNSGVIPGLEIWVKLDEGKSMVVTQPVKEKEDFKVGERVRVVHKKGELRVEHEPDSKPAQP
ncbi:MAG: hypothetical protein PHT15_07335 [Gallionellaceae bacterium]|nr:hypothetical protein [Gallionellaceae bacterium]